MYSTGGNSRSDKPVDCDDTKTVFLTLVFFLVLDFLTVNGILFGLEWIVVVFVWVCLTDSGTLLRTVFKSGCFCRVFLFLLVLVAVVVLVLIVVVVG
jgi:hypothetical protein